MSTIICYLLLLCLALPFLVSAGRPVHVNGDPTLPYPQWGDEVTMDVCSPWSCHADGAANWLNFTIAQNNVNTVCTNLVGAAGAEVGFVINERRNTCIQIETGDNAYKWNFDIVRNACDFLPSATLDFGSCTGTLNDILDGYTTWCDARKIWVIGGGEQVVCFHVFSSAQKGLCPGSVPWDAF